MTETFQRELQEAVAQAGELRAASFSAAVHLAHQSGARRIVETGTTRMAAGTEGNSTRIWALYARLVGGQFWSVDTSAESIAQSRIAVGEAVGWVKYCPLDSVEFLSRFKWPIDVLYLDSRDCDLQDTAPSEAQRHQLAEVGAALGKLRSGALVLLDDCGPGGAGKGFLSGAFLRQRGWLLKADGYQQLFQKP